MDNYARFFIKENNLSVERKNIIECIFEARELGWNETTIGDRKNLVLKADWNGKMRKWPARLILVPFIESLAVRCKASKISWQKVVSTEFKTAMDVWKRYFSGRPGKAKMKVCLSTLEVAIRTWNSMTRLDCFEQLELMKDWIYHKLGYRTFAEKDPSIQLSYEMGEYSFVCLFFFVPYPHRPPHMN